MWKAKQAIATSVLVASCSSVSTSTSLTASCGTYPKQNIRPSSMSTPILSNLRSSKTIVKANKKSTGRKRKMLFVPIAVVDPSLHPNHTTTPVSIRWKCLTNKRYPIIGTTIWKRHKTAVRSVEKAWLNAGAIEISGRHLIVSSKCTRPHLTNTVYLLTIPLCA